eukprot:TRINITY_DN1485_c0_g2_i13.p1 TRINITY_DN1485_c0_g2~~TRINITY_DN1485_c0_g2_i13.p1  ORF type:complete len:359 (-),score=58.00 TRINITY_DN1485_c0_g2_i13:1541-2617(-)
MTLLPRSLLMSSRSAFALCARNETLASAYLCSFGEDTTNSVKVSHYGEGRSTTLNTRGSHPTLRDGFSLSIFKNRLILFGGARQSGGDLYSLGPMQPTQERTNRVFTWSQISAGAVEPQSDLPPKGLHRHFAFVHDSHLFVVGGSTPQSGSLSFAPHEVFRLDLQQFYWRRIALATDGPCAPLNTANATAVQLGNLVWFRSQTGQDSVLDLHAATWTLASDRAQKILEPFVDLSNEAIHKFGWSWVASGSSLHGCTLSTQENDEQSRLNEIILPLKSPVRVPRSPEMDIEWVPSFMSPMAQPFDEAHDEACINLETTYKDPATGYTCFSRFGLLDKGFCCGNRCRHCPYEHCNVPKSN